MAFVALFQSINKPRQAIVHFDLLVDHRRIGHLSKDRLVPQLCRAAAYLTNGRMIGYFGEMV